MDYDDYHPQFIKNLKKSEAARKVVARHLELHGMVDLPPLEIAPKRSDNKAYADAGDIYFWANKDPERRQIIEVKGRSLSFTGREDFPFPTVFVDRRSCYEKKEGKGARPDFYITLSRDMSMMAIIPVALTLPHWRVGTTTGPYTGDRHNVYEVLECPIDLVIFRRVFRSPAEQAARQA